jgi:RimJ/RimL family protein N-acetyltransferase
MAARPAHLDLQLDVTDDPRAFLDAAADHLAADPVVHTVIASVTARLAAADPLPPAAHPRWWAVARDASRDGADAVVGVAMRTAPYAPHPVYVLPMPDRAAVALAEAVHARGEALGGVNGALPAARVVAETYADRVGADVRVREHLRLFEVREVAVPPAPPGRLRSATEADAQLVLAWFRDFGRAAAEQAGRSEPHAGSAETFTLADALVRIRESVVWLWEDAAGEVVHLTAANPPAYGVTRIGPVYTPVEHRGRGYASAAVAAVSLLQLRSGVRVCLFTDQANPTSNRVYEALGYRPLVDMVNLALE